ncbi:MAG TPA: cytochrome C biogenesis protein [Archaeoglobaceae archaeon]|nr:cytochrome C biogenesis protein [Archaeoglobaceae archaeon]
MKFLEVAKKDLKIEFRTKNTLNLMLLFALITSMMFSLTIPIGVASDVAPALLWLVFLFVGMIGYARAFLREVELETLDGLKISPLSPADILVGKMIYNLVLMLLMEIIILPIFIALFDLHIENPLLAFSSVTLGNTGFVIVASSLSILVLKSRARELLLPVIMFPIIFPIISSTIYALSASMKGTSVEEVYPTFFLIMSFSIVMFAVSLLTSDYAFSE